MEEKEKLKKEIEDLEDQHGAVQIEKNELTIILDSMEKNGGSGGSASTIPAAN